MDKKTLILLGALLTNCQGEKPLTLKHLPIPDIEKIISEIRPKEEPEEKVQPKGTRCMIDLSDEFIPELLSLSRDAQQYFSTEGILQNPVQRERFGIFSSFAHHQKPFEHYAKAIGRRRGQEQPKIESSFVPYTSEKTIKRISSLEQQLRDNQLAEKQKEKMKKELETLQKQVQEIKDIQQILQWEELYKGEIDGIYDVKTSAAVMKYQRFQQQRLPNQYVSIDGISHELKADGKINKSTRHLLNKRFEEYAFTGVHRVLEERVFHARCDGRHPYVIEQQELEKLAKSAAEQLSLHTVEGLQKFFSEGYESATVDLDLPQRYTQDSMKLEIDVEKWDSGKWEKIRTKTNVRLYAVEEEDRVQLLQTKAVVGGWVKNKKKGTKKQYKTPTREFYLKRVIILPHWIPPEWAAAEEEVKEEEKLPGPFNAFGMLNTPLYYDNKAQKDPFHGWQDGDHGYRIHLTPWPSSVENGGNSHGCIRIHPNMSRFFYFIIGYTPHTIALENFEGKKTLKFTPSRGSYIPLKPEHYIKVRTCEEKCE